MSPHGAAAASSPSSAAPHPRRAPAQYSVSLRRGLATSRVAAPSRAPAARLRWPVLPAEVSEGSARSQDGLDIKRWFDRSNKRPHAALHTTRADNEPPYFLPNESSNDSPEGDEAAGEHGRGAGFRNPLMARVAQRSTTHESSAGDFRSVIDDLTVENKKLKERLRKYEAVSQAHLDKDKLFEVKVHGLPAAKKRELERVLCTFASELEQDQTVSKTAPRANSLKGELAKTRPLPHPSLDSGRKSAPNHSSSASTFTSRPVDSAYASMSVDASGGKQTSPDKMTRQAEDQKVRSFLHDIPEGFFPRHSPTLTERQKKKMVVRRLEQLFIGRTGAVAGELSQPQQQQEVSKTAAREDFAAHTGPSTAEGVREAHILSPAGGAFLPEKIPEESTMDGLTSNNASDCESSLPSSPPQRPTRPLDLDPDRAQVPADNVEYIRHLGLSTPQLFTEDSEDADSDADGWVYFNLLTNMAQLHIINVTPDFVRSAVAEVSEKFQLSSDGTRIRWRGGNVGTRLSSDSGASSMPNQSPNDSDDVNEANRKRRKLEAGRFASVPFDTRPPNQGAAHRNLKSFYYKPLFRHRNSWSSGINSSEDSDIQIENGRDLSTPSQPRPWNGKSPPTSRGRDDGPIVFYSGTRFFTDLSGDRGMARTPLHVMRVDQDGFSTQTHHVLGCAKPRIPFPLNRTTSGSIMPFRPFKSPTSLVSEEVPDTPDLVVADESDLDFETEWSDDSGPATPLITFQATGLGGTQPADHFAVRVETRRKRVPAHKISKHPRTISKGSSIRKISHIVTQDSLDSFRELQVTDPSSPLLKVNSTPSPTNNNNLPITTEVVSTLYVQLPPSELPPPSGYYASLSSSEAESSGFSNGTSAGVSHLRHQKPTFIHRSSSGPSDEISPRNASANSKRPPLPDITKDTKMDLRGGEVTSSEADDEDGDEDDDDESIDMLAQAREFDPEAVAAGEREFEELRRREREEEEEREVQIDAWGKIRSTVATVSKSSGSSSGYESYGEESGSGSEIYGEMEDDDEDDD